MDLDARHALQEDMLVLKPLLGKQNGSALAVLKVRPA